MGLWRGLFIEHFDGPTSDAPLSRDHVFLPSPMRSSGQRLALGPGCYSKSLPDQADMMFVSRSLLRGGNFWGERARRSQQSTHLVSPDKIADFIPYGDMIGLGIEHA